MCKFDHQRNSLLCPLFPSVKSRDSLKSFSKCLFLAIFINKPLVRMTNQKKWTMVFASFHCYNFDFIRQYEIVFPTKICQSVHVSISFLPSQTSQKMLLINLLQEWQVNSESHPAYTLTWEVPAMWVFSSVRKDM